MVGTLKTMRGLESLRSKTLIVLGIYYRARKLTNTDVQILYTSIFLNLK